MDALIGPAVGAAAITVAATFLANVVLEKRAEIKKRRGLIVALLAEISERRRAQRAFLDGTDVDAVKAAIDAHPDYIPFTTSDPDFSRALYDDLRRDIAALDADTLTRVVKFYVEDNFTQSMVLDLRSPEFRELAAERKKRYLDLLMTQASETVAAGDEALGHLRAVTGDRSLKQSVSDRSS
jgi:hypothetical protein